MTVPTYEHVEARTAADLLRSSATVVWIFLIAATMVSWALGTDHGFITDHVTASVVILVVAFVKVRFIGLYFMELKDAPLVLRALIEFYCVAVLAVTLGFYLAG
jgi:hypothetical protein